MNDEWRIKNEENLEFGIQRDVDCAGGDYGIMNYEVVFY